MKKVSNWHTLFSTNKAKSATCTLWMKMVSKSEGKKFRRKLILYCTAVGYIYDLLQLLLHIITWNNDWLSQTIEKKTLQHYFTYTCKTFFITSKVIVSCQTTGVQDLLSFPFVHCRKTWKRFSTPVAYTYHSCPNLHAAPYTTCN